MERIVVLCLLFTTFVDGKNDLFDGIDFNFDNLGQELVEMANNGKLKDLLVDVVQDAASKYGGKKGEEIFNTSKKFLTVLEKNGLPSDQAQAAQLGQDLTNLVAEDLIHDEKTRDWTKATSNMFGIIGRTNLAHLTGETAVLALTELASTLPVDSVHLRNALNLTTGLVGTGILNGKKAPISLVNKVSEVLLSNPFISAGKNPVRGALVEFNIIASRFDQATSDKNGEIDIDALLDVTHKYMADYVPAEITNLVMATVTSISNDGFSSDSPNQWLKFANNLTELLAEEYLGGDAKTHTKTAARIIGIMSDTDFGKVTLNKGLTTMTKMIAELPLTKDMKMGLVLTRKVIETGIFQGKNPPLKMISRLVMVVLEDEAIQNAGKPFRTAYNELKDIKSRLDVEIAENDGKMGLLPLIELAFSYAKNPRKARSKRSQDYGDDYWSDDPSDADPMAALPNSAVDEGPPVADYLDWEQTGIKPETKSGTDTGSKISAHIDWSAKFKEFKNPGELPILRTAKEDNLDTSGYSVECIMSTDTLLRHHDLKSRAKQCEGGDNETIWLLHENKCVDVLTCMSEIRQNVLIYKVKDNYPILKLEQSCRSTCIPSSREVSYCPVHAQLRTPSGYCKPERENYVLVRERGSLVCRKNNCNVKLGTQEPMYPRPDACSKTCIEGIRPITQASRDPTPTRKTTKKKFVTTTSTPILEITKLPFTIVEVDPDEIGDCQTVLVEKEFEKPADADCRLHRRLGWYYDEASDHCRWVATRCRHQNELFGSQKVCNKECGKLFSKGNIAMNTQPPYPYWHGPWSMEYNYDEL